MYSYRIKNTKWFPDMRTRRTVIVTDDQIDDPVKYLAETIDDIVERFHVPEQAVIHIVLTHLDHTQGFTLHRIDGMPIKPNMVRDKDFMSEALNVMANKILHSNESWIIDGRTELTVNFYFPPPDWEVTYKV